MAELGKLSDINLLGEATLTGAGGLDPTYGLAQLQTDRDFIQSPCRWLDRTDLDQTQFTATWAEPQVISLVAPLFHSMGLSAKYRVQALGEDGEEVLGDTGWLYVFPSLYDTAELDITAENVFAGTVTQAEIDLYPRHRWTKIPEVLAFGLKVEFDDSGAGEGHLDVGGFWVAAGWSPVMNFERGRGLAIAPRDLIDEAASGKRFVEERQPRRELTLAYDMLRDVEAHRWIDAAMRARSSRPVIFVPDVDDEPAMMREAFPANFGRVPGVTFRYDRLNQTAVSLSEILA